MKQKTLKTGFLLTLLSSLAFTSLKAEVTSSQMDSQESEARANRGIALLEQFRFAEAIEEFESLVALQPDSAAAHVNLAIAFFNQRDFEQARKTLEKARDLDSDSPYVHYNLGLIHKLQGRTEEAITAFEEVEQQDPTDSMTHYYLGTLYANLGDLEKAASHLRTTVRLQPSNEAAHFSLGNILIRQGNIEEGRKELEEFQKLKEAFPAESASAGLQYTEMGKFAEALEGYTAPLHPLAAETIAETNLRWTEVTAESGLELDSLPAPSTPPDSVPVASYGADFIEEHLLPGLGSGLAFRDLDSDQDPDLIFLRSGRPLVFINEGGRFRQREDAGLPTDGAGKFVSLTLGDVDNDLDADVYLVGAGPNRLFLNDGSGNFSASPGEESSGTAGNDISVAATFVDIDHDGDLDIYVSNYLDPDVRSNAEMLRIPTDLPGAPNRLYRNNGDGSFSEVSVETRTDGGAARSLGALFSDLDEDRDIDFLVVNDAEPLQVFSNERVGGFTETSLAWGIEGFGRLRGVDSADFDQDGHFDLFLTADGSVLNLLLRGSAGSGFAPDVVSPRLLSAGVPGGRFGTAFADVDNDTDLDLLLVVNEPGALVAIYENTPTGFQRAVVLDSPDADVGSARALAVADVDNDGKLDAAVGTDRGRILLFRNESEATGGWIRILAQGLRSNKDGLGTKVELKAGKTRQRRETRAASSFLSQNDRPLHFGLGPHRAADYIRFLWPGGVKQIEMDIAGGQTVAIEELNRKGTSCPLMYTWDGEKIRFVTDFLGGSAIGNLLAPGRYNYPDTEEYVKLEQFEARPREGAYDLRWVNQLEEVMMYDKAALVAVDHPADVEIFPNERLMPAPPYPEARHYAVRDIRIPQRVVDHRGRDVTGLIIEKDRTYPEEFELLPFKGYAEEHSLTLDLGPLRSGEHVVLLLYGWVDYADSSSNLAASQAGVKGIPPYLEVADPGGGFRPGLAQMGFPAGLPKSMLVDLEGLVGPDSNRIRITTNMRLYWDQIQLATVVPEGRVTITELAPDRAELRFRGYPAPFSPDGRAPFLYDYQRSAQTDLWDAHQGHYTRRGDVMELVDRVDDRYVIVRHGDELALSFRADRLPDLPDGWRRTLLVLSDGFGKDMDLNSARPDRVEPLPFHGMSAYPYPPDEHYPSSEAHRRYRETYNTRWIERDRAWPADLVEGGTADRDETQQR